MGGEDREALREALEEVREERDIGG